MALFKRNTIWWVRFTAPDGARIRRSTGTADRAKAQEYHDELKASLWRVHHLGERPRRTWQEAVVKWLKETAHKKTHQDDIAKLRWLDGFLRDRYLDEISREDIEHIAQAKEAEGVQPATVNRHLALIRAILRRASQDWGWIGQVPKVRVRREPKRRVRFLTQDEAGALIAAIPEHLAELARFSVATGLRASNVVGLRWSQVDMDRVAAWIHPDQGWEGDCGAAQRSGASSPEAPAGPSPGVGVHVPGTAVAAVQHEGVVSRLAPRRRDGFSLARLAPHLGLVACAVGDAAVRAAGTGRVVKHRDGAALCASRLCSSSLLCPERLAGWHKSGTRRRVAGSGRRRN